MCNAVALSLRRKSTYHIRRSAGLCYRCGGARDSELGACAACREAMIEESKIKTIKAASNGKCYRCGDPIDNYHADGRRKCYCVACSEVDNARKRKQYVPTQGVAQEST